MTQVNIRGAGVEALLKPQLLTLPQQFNHLFFNDNLSYPAAEQVVKLVVGQLFGVHVLTPIGTTQYGSTLFDVFRYLPLQLLRCGKTFLTAHPLNDINLYFLPV